jgi:hypothetical protein|tara:strand:- start:309 stop:635 length:327 start_codon:yes stop_codon:yes gene_type:complete
MKLLTKAIETKLRANFVSQQENQKPVLKLFGGAAFTLLATEMDHDGNLFGLADLGFGSPELGWTNFAEIEAVRFPPFNLPVERDLYFVTDKTISEYADEARITGRIVA